MADQPSENLIIRPWWFTGFHGLKVLQNEPPFDFSLFGDVAITSSDTVRSRFRGGGTWPPYLDFVQMALKYGDKVVDILELANISTDCFLVLRRSGTWTDPEPELPEVLNRAKEVSAALTLLYFVLSKGERICGMPGELHHWTGQAMATTAELTCPWFMFTGSSSPVKMLEPLTVNISELIAHSQSEVANILFGVFTQRSLVQIKSRLKNKIKSCCLRLVHAIRAVDHETRLLSSRIMLEMMMSTSNQDLLSDRTKSLVGVELFEQYKGPEVFKARNAYVHNGYAVDSRTAALSLGLSTHALFAFLNAALRCANTESILVHLDALKAASKSQSIWDPGNLLNVNDMVGFDRLELDLSRIPGL